MRHSIQYVIHIPNLRPVKWHGAFKPYADQAVKRDQSAAEFLRAPAKFKVHRKSTSELNYFYLERIETVKTTSDQTGKFQVHSAERENHFIRNYYSLSEACLPEVKMIKKNNKRGGDHGPKTTLLPFWVSLWTIMGHLTVNVIIYYTILL